MCFRLYGCKRNRLFHTRGNRNRRRSDFPPSSCRPSKRPLPSFHILNKNQDLDALISFNYEVGLKAVKTIKNGFHNLTTRDLILFDEEFEELYDLLAYKLNYIKQDAFLIGQTAFSIILEKTQNPDFLNRHIVIPEKIYFNTH